MIDNILVADKWGDYQLLDCGEGMKQERWGEFVLVRPDPQILWPRSSRKPWKKYDAIYRRSSKGGGHWEFTRDLPESWIVRYRDLSFKIRPTNFKHTGLFPEQAVNWDWSDALIRNAGRPVRVLNLFGYTGGATVAAARAGAEVCHVDSAKGMVQWCRDNAELSGLKTASIRYIVEDCLTFVQREIRRGKSYEGIIMDPPSYGRGKSGETWKLEENLCFLLTECRKLLSEKPLFFLLNAYTASLSPTVLRNVMIEAFRGGTGDIYTGEIGLPVQSDGKILPCGVFVRKEWTL